MIDPFVLLTPVLVLAVMALVRFIGCDITIGRDTGYVIFNPPGGGYFSQQTVTLASSLAGGGAQYTTDGSDPTSSSTAQVYTGPIPVSGTTTIKAVDLPPRETYYALPEGWGPIRSQTYIIGPITFQQFAELDDQTNMSPDPTAVTTPTTGPGSFAGSIAQNTLMVVWIYYRGPDDGSITVSSVTDPAGNSYFPAVGPTPQGTEPPALLGHRQEIWYAVITHTDTGGMPFTVTAHFTAPVTVDKAISAHAYVGANPSDPLDKASDMTPIVASASGLSGAVSAGPVTTNFARLVFAAAVYVNAAGGPGPGFRQRSALSGNVSEDADVPNLGQVVQATFAPATNPWIAQMCAFK
jgi:hypothetical protein